MVNAVAGLRDRAHIVVAEVAASKSKHREEYAALALVFNKLFELLGIADAYVEITVGCDDDAVVAVSLEVRLCDLISLDDACLAVGRATRGQIVDSGKDDLLLVAGSSFKHHALTARVGYDRNRVVLVELINEIRESLLEKRELVG